MKKNKHSKKSNNNHNKNSYWIYGKHAVMSAIYNPKRSIFKILTTVDSFNKETQNILNEKNIHPEKVDKSEIDSLFPAGSVHQGMAAEVAFLENHSIEEVCEDKTNNLVIILDQVTDPHNIGAIMRSAAAFSADAIIVPDKNTCQETAVLAKTASGALDIVPMVRVNNLVSAITTLQKNDFWIIGLDGQADKELSQIDSCERTALIMGSEGDGIRRLILENCDFVAKLPISNKIESLNVSNAAAVALYEIARKKNS